MAVSASQVKQLREATSAPMMACKRALEDADGDLERAAELVRERTGARMDERAASRTASEGMIQSYLHTASADDPPKVGVMVELNCETDFVARNERFQGLARDVAMHVAAMRPRWVSRDDVDDDVLERERSLARRQAEEAGKPEEIIDRIVKGKLEKFYEESVLLDQPYVRDDSKTVGELVSEVQAVLGEKVTVGRFVRFEV